MSLPSERPSRRDAPGTILIRAYAAKVDAALSRAARGRLGATWRVGSRRRPPVPELEALADRMAIGDALTRYTLAVDRGTWDDLDDVFTMDAHIDYSASGGTAGTFPEVKAWLAETLPAFSTRTMHTLGQVSVTFTPGRAGADVAAYFHNPMVVSDRAGAERVVEVGGVYHHSFVRTAGGWRSRTLREEVLWTRGF